ncbi:MAG TPA: hypothetical protein ENI80_03385 [Acidiferrobacteraceae bacterium]|nr:hypothetical protein [Acidiferrobacteraceae bacterium]
MGKRQFLDEIAIQADSLRKEMEAQSLGLDPSADAVRARRKRVLSGDFKFFAYTYFPHHIHGEPSEFQAHFCDRFPRLLFHNGGAREWWVAPRGEAKSSLLCKVGPVYVSVIALLQRPDIRKAIGWRGDPPPLIDYVVFLGAETRQPTKLMEVSKIELMFNAALAIDFPEVVGKSDKWKVGEYISRTGVKFEPFGAEQAIRGTSSFSSRPGLALADDIITDKEAKSPTERSNRWNWLENAAKYLGPPDGSLKLLGVGTFLNKDDPISRAKKAIGHIVHTFKAIIDMPGRMDLWEKCEELMRNFDPGVALEYAERGDVAPLEVLPSFKYYMRNKKRMHQAATVSWPSVRSLYSLMRERADNRRAFDSEMQGEPRSDEDQVFTEWHFWVQRLNHWIFYGACDPSMGKGQTSDPSAITIGGYDTKINKLHVIEASSKRRVPSKLQYDLIVYQQEYSCAAWGFENNNAYEAMRQSFIDAAMREKVSLPLVGMTASVAPEIRIDSLEPFIVGMEPKMLFHASLRLLFEQMSEWPDKQSHHHFDLLVALHLLWVTAVSRAGGMPKIRTRRNENRTDMRGYD